MLNQIFKFLFFMCLSSCNLLLANETIDILRAQKVYTFIENEYNMKDRVNAYIIKTADLTPTRGEIQTQFGLGEDFWDNYEKERCTLSGGICVGNTGAGVNLSVDTTKKTVELANSLGSSPNSYVIQAYINDNDNERNVDGTYNTTFPMSIEAGNMVDLVVALSLQDGVHIGITPPTDTTDIWYEPDGKGGLNIKKYNTSTGTWDNVGSTSSAGKGIVYAANEEELKTIPCLAGDSGYTEGGDLAVPYTCISDGSWKQIEGGGSGNSLFNGEATILDIVTSKMSSAGGSTASCSAPSAEFVGVKDFVKKDSTFNSGYWVAENIYIATSDMESLMSQSWALNSYGWLPKSDKNSLYTLQVKSVPGVGTKWVYIADGYDDVVSGFDDISTLSGGWVYDKKNDQYFQKFNNVWTNVTGTIKLTNGSLGRDEFSTLNSSITYYVGFDDCSASTCNGTSGSYAGEKFDNMFTYYYSTAGLRKNNLIDAIPAASMTEIYNNLYTAALYGGYVYLKDLDNKSRLCYKRAGTSTYVTKSNVVIPTGNNIPYARTCSTISYSGSYAVLSNRTEMTDWTDAPTGAYVSAAGNSYRKYIGASNDGYWRSASEWITNGSRSDFDTASSSSIVYLSKQVGTEPNYTTAGVTASVDASYKQWFYSLTGTTTNNLLDAVLITDNPYTNSTAISVGIAVKNNTLIQKSGNYWIKFGTTTYVDKDLIARDTAQIRAIGASYAGYYDACTETTPVFVFDSPNKCTYTNSYTASYAPETNAYGTKSFSLGKTRTVVYTIINSETQQDKCGEYHHYSFIYLNGSRIATGAEIRSSAYSTASRSSSINSSSLSLVGNNYMERTCTAKGTMNINMSFSF